jgi:DNA-binding IclR family transcriptional regulator
MNYGVRIVNSSKQSKGGQYRIKVLHKAFRLLELFTEEVPELSAAEIREKLRHNKTTSFRLISNLEEEGFLDQDPETNKYRLGMKLFLLGNLVRPYRYIRNAAKPLLERLNKDSGETVHLAVLHKGQALYVDKIESTRTVRVVVSQVGRKLPAHCSGVGKVLLAHLPAGQVKEIVAEKGLDAFTQNTITTYGQLRSELDRVIQNGVAYDNEEIEIGLKCAAAPVFFDGHVVAALSVSAPRERFDANREDLVRMVIHTAQELSRALNENLKDKNSAAGSSVVHYLTGSAQSTKCKA